MDTMTENYTFNNDGNITGWDEVQTWKIKVTNTRQLSIEAQITRGFGMPYWALLLVDPASTDEDAVDYEKYDATHARFTTQLSPRSKKIFAYTVRKYHGRRQRAMPK